MKTDLAKTGAALAFALLAAFPVRAGGAAGPVREMVAKFWSLMPVLSAKDATAKPESVTLPDDTPSLWGTWKFWNGQWWAQCLFQAETRGESWTEPAGGMKHSLGEYRGAWMKVKRDIPAEWKGNRVVYSLDAIRGCDVVLFVNRKLAGIIRQPAGELEIAPLLAFGASNEFHMLLVSTGDARFKFDKDPPFLVVKPPVCIEDVFANTSWRKKTLTVETEVTVPKDCSGTIQAEVVDADGKTVKTVSGNFNFKKGTSVAKPSVAWPDPITWELGRGYLYTLKTKVTIGGRDYAYRDVKFGFREIWRDERKIFMNGHEQKYRVTYNFGCNAYGAKFLTLLGYNCIQYAHRTEPDPLLREDELEYLSANGIAAIEPTCAFDWNTKGPLLKPGEKREAFKKLQAKNLRRYRNWPCIAMYYMGVNTYLPQWAYEAIHMGSGDQSEFAKMMEDLVASAKKTNPNVLYFSHSDGNTGEIASANLYLNWVPLQEREEWPSRWAERGHFPFQACEFGHPYQYSWYKGDRDLITEYCAIYYGEEAYLQEPLEIQKRHKPRLFIRRILHPLFWKLTEDFCWRTTRAWRTFGVNAGIVWFNLDYGYGMPGWKYPNIWNKYGPNYGFFKSEADIPKGKPEWAFPSWDIYRKGNLDFLGWLAGAPRITDRRHAYWPGETVEKQSVMMWDRFDTCKFTATWTATLDGRKIGGGSFAHDLVSNVPKMDRIAFTAPEVVKKTQGLIKVVFADAAGQEVEADEFAFEVYPCKTYKWERAPEFALYDPDGKSEPELRKLGVVNIRKVDSLQAVGNARHLVVGSFALDKDGGWKALPMEAVEKGLKVLVLPQTAAALGAFGLDVQDRQSRILFVRDRVSPAFRDLGDDSVREWNGAPRTGQGNAYGLQQYGSLSPHGKHEPRWTYNMSVAALQIRTPDVAGWIPQIEGELDMNYSALAKYAFGKGSVQFCTLDFLGRILTGAQEKDEAKPADDPAIRLTATSVLADFLLVPNPADAGRTVIADGAAAERIATELGAKLSASGSAGAGNVLLVGKDSKLTSDRVIAAARAGANVLVVCNDAVARGLGFTLAEPGEGVYRVTFDHANPALRGIGQSQLRWRDRLTYAKLSGGRDGAKIDCEGLFASITLQNGAKIFVSQYDPFQLEDRISTEPTYLVDDKPRPYENDKARADVKRLCDISFERSHQFTARLLTTLGARPVEGAKLYNGLVKAFDPYEFIYW